MSKQGKELIQKLNSMGLTPVMFNRIQDFYSLEKLTEEEYEIIKEELNAYDEPLYISFEDLKNLGEIKSEASGGIHHDGGTYWEVIRFEKFGVFLGYEAIYSSWDSSEVLNVWYEVKPKKITVTVWVDEKGIQLG